MSEAKRNGLLDSGIIGFRDYWIGGLVFQRGAGLALNLVAQVGNLLCRRLAVGRNSNLEPLRITNPRYSRLPVCATPSKSMVPMRSRLFWDWRLFMNPAIQQPTHPL